MFVPESFLLLQHDLIQWGFNWGLWVCQTGCCKHMVGFTRISSLTFGCISFSTNYFANFCFLLHFVNVLATGLHGHSVSDVFIPLPGYMVWLCYLACKSWLNRYCNQSISTSFEGSSRYLFPFFFFFYLPPTEGRILENCSISLFLLYSWTGW